MKIDEETALNVIDELTQSLIRVRYELVQAQREIERLKVADAALRGLRKSAPDFRQALTDVSWAMTLDEARAIARAAVENKRNKT